MNPRERLEDIRASIEAERISMGEIDELQGLAEYIEPGDVDLLQWAGVPEFGPEREAQAEAWRSHQVALSADSTAITGTDAVVTPLGEQGEADKREAVRMLRGSIYLAQLRVNRLTGSNATEGAVAQAGRALAALIERAIEEKVDPWYSETQEDGDPDPPEPDPDALYDAAVDDAILAAIEDGRPAADWREYMRGGRAHE